MRAALLCLALAFGCSAAPVPVDGGLAVTPTSWVSTASEIVSVLQVALPAAEAVVPLMGASPATVATIDGAITVAQQTALPALVSALATYQREATGSALCAARAATDALATALEGIASAAGSAGFGLAPEIDLALSGLAGILDGTAFAGCAVSSASGVQVTSFRLGLPVALRPWPATSGVHR